MSFNINIGLLLSDNQYFNNIRDIIRNRDNHRLKKLREDNPELTFCVTCGGFGVLVDNKKIKLESLTSKAVVEGIAKSIIDYANTLGARENFGQQIKNIKDYVKVLREEYKFFKKVLHPEFFKVNRTPFYYYLTQQNRSLIKKANISICPSCQGLGIMDIDHDPPLSFTVYKIAYDIAINEIQKNKNVDLFEIEVDYDKYYKEFKSRSKLSFITRQENRKKGNTNDKPALDRLRAKVRLRLKNYLKLSDHKKAQNLKDIVQVAYQRQLDEAFAKWLVKRLRSTVRVDTGLSKRKMKYNIVRNERNRSFLIYITSAKIGDKPGLSNTKFANTQYIKFYSDFSGVRRNEWNPKKGISSLKKYLEDSVTKNFIQRHRLDAYFPRTSGLVLTKKLLRLVELFGEKYGG